MFQLFLLKKVLNLEMFDFPLQSILYMDCYFKTLKNHLAFYSLYGYKQQ